MTCIPLPVFPFYAGHSAMNVVRNVPYSPHGRNSRRPKGLWKARGSGPRFHVAGKVPEKHLATAAAFRTTSTNINNTNSDSDHDTDADIADHDDDDDKYDTDSSSSSKRRRTRSGTDTPASSDEDDVCYWDYLRQKSPRLERVSRWRTRVKLMDTSTTAGSGTVPADTPNCDIEDWEDLKELFAKAVEQYEGDDTSGALPLLRGVIHECHRFLMCYQDPSVLFSNPSLGCETHQPEKPSKQVRTFGELQRHRSSPKPIGKDRYPRLRSLSPQPPLPHQRDRKCKCLELPTAFHAILGSALFLLGNLIGQDPSSALEGEPSTPLPYWLAALDVFETGENLPSRTSGHGCDAPEDWRMSIAWGRTLVCIVDEAVTRAKNSDSSILELTDADEPSWPSDSPFSTIAARRPPVTMRMSLMMVTPNDLMVMAMDQFSRGIFHMPHLQHGNHHHHTLPQSSAPASSSTSQNKSNPVLPFNPETFSRAKELYTIATDVLDVAEKFKLASERQYWAAWADGVFGQIKMEDNWRDPVTRGRGQCWLIVGSARAEELEGPLERGEVEILQSEEANEAREALEKAIGFLERAKMKGWEENESTGERQREEGEDEELAPLLAEALVTLANMTSDEVKREELYARAQKEGGHNLDLGLYEGEQMDVSP